MGVACKYNGPMLPMDQVGSAPYPVPSLNETLLRVIRDRVSKGTIVVRTDDKPWFDDWCVLLHRAKQKAYRVVVGEA